MLYNEITRGNCMLFPKNLLSELNANEILILMNLLQKESDLVEINKIKEGDYFKWSKENISADLGCSIATSSRCLGNLERKGFVKLNESYCSFRGCEKIYKPFIVPPKEHLNIGIPTRSNIIKSKSYSYVEKDLCYKVFLKLNKEFNHKLPKDNKVTKVVKSSLSYLNQLLNGSFLSNIDLDVDEDYYNLNEIKRPLTLIELNNLIDIVIRRWKLIHKPSYFPQNKDSLKIPMDKFFYNCRTKKSWFLNLLDEPNEIIQTCLNDLENELGEEIINEFDKIYDVGESNRLVYLNNMKNFVDYLNDWRKEYEIYYSTSNIDVSNLSFVKMFVEYLRSYKKLELHYLKVGSFSWNDFVSNIYSKGIYLVVESEEKKLLKKIYWKGKYDNYLKNINFVDKNKLIFNEKDKEILEEFYSNFEKGKDI